jgi:hypothetical protein
VKTDRLAFLRFRQNYVAQAILASEQNTRQTQTKRKRSSLTLSEPRYGYPYFSDSSGLYPAEETPKIFFPPHAAKEKR